MKTLLRIYYKLFPTYKQLEMKVCTWDDADKIIRNADHSNPEAEWHIAKEDAGMTFPFVAIERRKRITQ